MINACVLFIKWQFFFTSNKLFEFKQCKQRYKIFATRFMKIQHLLQITCVHKVLVFQELTSLTTTPRNHMIETINSI